METKEVNPATKKEKSLFFNWSMFRTVISINHCLYGWGPIVVCTTTNNFLSNQGQREKEFIMPLFKGGGTETVCNFLKVIRQFGAKLEIE